MVNANTILPKTCDTICIVTVMCELPYRLNDLSTKIIWKKEILHLGSECYRLSYNRA